MKEFDALIAVAERLLGPKGCPWDLEQNFYTLQPYILEEAHEVVEAVDSGENQKICEELGDLLYTIIFYSRLAEKEGLFKMEDLLNGVKEKLIRRHPHIFGEEEINEASEVIERWDAIKKEEAGHRDRKSALDGIPERLPLLMRAQKLLKKIKKANYSFKSSLDEGEALTEAEAGQEILNIILKAQKGGVECESALRRQLNALESEFRKWEESAGP